MLCQNPDRLKNIVDEYSRICILNVCIKNWIGQYYKLQFSNFCRIYHIASKKRHSIKKFLPNDSSLIITFEVNHVSKFL